ncbi:SMI1/KNR4 family protein [Streptomyces sp. DSM 44915]|uniref:SMI1/KNR4 family protein n=1 Tax=Streptomyces chisholmiae TaxID=3075540 RepID=A0ABU2JIE3_9ACTN|nr:SMI1/KNR4 family protein [Streptomyces sp. DSM 44915]MDT0264747.1 SMI1/KNR4 family protein [Streptomyces sp. DSM 44915]
MTDSAIPPVAASWRRIDAWLAAHAPASAALLAPPAEPAALAAAEAALGAPLPADLAASLRRHDGASATVDVLPDLRLLSAARVVEEWELRVEAERELRAEDEDDLPPLPGGGPYWHERWVPVAEFQGDVRAIDARPGPRQGRFGPVYHDAPATFDDRTSWPSLAHCLADLAAWLVDRPPVAGARHWDDPFVGPAGELVWGWPPSRVRGLDGPGGPAEHGYRVAPVGLPG